MSMILLPTDFSDNARNAFEYALSLFGTDHKYILFNSYEEPASSTASMISLKDILAEASIDSLKEEKAELIALHPGVDMTTVSLYGDPIQAITQYAKKVKADLIVMGTTGASGLKKILIGSVASSVIQLAECPVVLVPVKYQYEPLAKILLTSDLESDSDTIPKVLSDMIKKNKSEITILTVKSEDEEVDMEKAEHGFSLHLALNGSSHEFDVVEGDDIAETIREYARDNGMQLLVTTPRNSSWFDRLFNPSVSKELAEELEIPMLALR